MPRLLLVLLVFTFAVPAAAQSVSTDDPWCTDSDGYDAERYCEVRTFDLGTRGAVRADVGANGGIRVEAWDGDEVQLRARVQAQAQTAAAAERLAERVTIDTGNTLRPRIPGDANDAWASVSFELRVPARTDLDLTANNGGISVEAVNSAIRFRTQNGGVRLIGVGGDVQGRTQNGGLSIRLTGDRWNGAGLDAQTTNGGVEMFVPDGYSADLETGTVNGGLRFGFPVTVEGDLNRRVRTTLGGGGPLIRAVTTNGGVKVERD